MLSAQSRATAGSNALNGNDRMAYEAGIRLFEVLYPIRDDSGTKRQLAGVFSVKVSEDYDHVENKTVYKEKWHTGYNAFVEYRPIDNRGTLVAYVPDDRWYHNRVILLDNPQIQVNQLLTLERGDIPRAEAMIQLQCLREIICEERPIYKIIRPNQTEQDWFQTEDEAKAFITQEETTYTGPQRNIPVIVRPFEKHTIKPGKRWMKRPEVEQMIIRYRGLEYGWTSCEEFVKSYIPRISRLIDERTKAFRQMTPDTPAVDIKAAIMDALSTLTPEQLESLKKQAEQRAAEAGGSNPDKSAKQRGGQQPAMRLN